MLERIDLHGYTVSADKGFAGQEFERLTTELGAIFLRPTARTNRAASAASTASANGSKSIIDTIKGQLSLERHGARTMPGLICRVAQRLLALAAALWHNWNTGNPGRHLTADDR
jgi:hypothetical protein